MNNCESCNCNDQINEAIAPPPSCKGETCAELYNANCVFNGQALPNIGSSENSRLSVILKLIDDLLLEHNTTTYIQQNCDWNSFSGASELLNKPSIFDATAYGFVPASGQGKLRFLGSDSLWHDLVINDYTASGGGIEQYGTDFRHALTSGATSSADDGITAITGIAIDGFGHITNIVRRAIEGGSSYLQGEGILIAGTTISHANTSDVANLLPEPRTYIKSLTFDNFGHVVGYTTGVETVTGDGTNAYTHPAYTSTNPTLTGAKVLASLVIDSIGSVAQVTVRDLTPADIGAAPAHEHPYDNYSKWSLAIENTIVRNILSSSALNLKGSGGISIDYVDDQLVISNSITAGLTGFVSGNLVTGENQIFFTTTETYSGSTAILNYTLNQQEANRVFISPNGTIGVPSFRKLVVGDLPTGTTVDTIALGNHAHNVVTGSTEGFAPKLPLSSQEKPGATFYLSGAGTWLALPSGQDSNWFRNTSERIISPLNLTDLVSIGTARSLGALTLGYDEYSNNMVFGVANQASGITYDTGLNWLTTAGSSLFKIRLTGSNASTYANIATMLKLTIETPTLNHVGNEILSDAYSFKLSRAYSGTVITNLNNASDVTDDKMRSGFGMSQYVNEAEYSTASITLTGLNYLGEGDTSERTELNDNGTGYLKNALNILTAGKIDYRPSINIGTRSAKPIRFFVGKSTSPMHLSNNNLAQEIWASGNISIGDHSVIGTDLKAMYQLEVLSGDIRLIKGRIQFGGTFGSEDSDVNLYRSSAINLKTDSYFQAAGYKSADGSIGVTGTYADTDGHTITIKNGIVTDVTSKDISKDIPA